MMLKTLEKSGKTEEAAIAAALEELGLDRDDVSVEIVERAKSGFLGIGKYFCELCTNLHGVHNCGKGEKREKPQ